VLILTVDFVHKKSMHPYRKASFLAMARMI